MSNIRNLFTEIPQLSDIKPSDWVQQNIVIPGKGYVDYDFNPYCRDIIDWFAPDHYARIIAIMKGSQLTFSTGVLIPLIGYMISQDPHNILFTVGKSENLKDAISKVDQMILQSKLTKYIQGQSGRSGKKGNTDFLKEFVGGFLRTQAITSAEAVAQASYDRMLLDDFDMMMGESSESGSVLKLLQMRAASYHGNYKMGLIGTPLLKGASNIEDAYLNGDQRRYHVECPNCHKPIYWQFKFENGEGGMTWKYDSLGRVDKKTVEYVCQSCGNAHSDKNKQRQLREGLWIPTARGMTDDYISCHISALSAPVGMFDWAFYAQEYIEACPDGKPKDERKYQVLVNTCFGETFEPESQSPKATSISERPRPYKPGIVPNALSEADGNGRIVLLTCFVDMGGVMNESREDVRLDYEVVGHSEYGPTYSILQGSIGTFVPKEGADNPNNRQLFTYAPGKHNSVWGILDKLLATIFPKDTGGGMRILLCGFDCGHFTNYAYDYLDSTNSPVIGVKGRGESKYTRNEIDVYPVKPAAERNKLYIAEVGIIKNRVSAAMELKWQEKESSQPFDYMNFPRPLNNMYEYETFFSHFEAEEKIAKLNTNGKLESFIWEKKKGNPPNHFWDCRVGNYAVKDIIIDIYRKANKDKLYTWQDWVRTEIPKK